MKKMIATLLAAGMLISLASCGRNNGDTLSSTSTSDSAQNTTESTGDNGGEAAESRQAEAFLQSIYNVFLGKIKPVYGVESIDEVKGYFIGPEVISLSDGEYLESQTLFPPASADQLGSAAAFYNMINLNNGTFVAFEVKDGEDVQAIADMMKEKVENNRWICGFPECFLIMRSDRILAFSYGQKGPVSAFKSSITSVYENAETLYDGEL